MKIYTYLPSIIVLIIVLSLFFVLPPKIQSQLSPSQSQKLLITFIDQTKQNQKVDPQQFWQTREFYSPGSAFLQKEGLPQQQTKDILSTAGIRTNPQVTLHSFLLFQSPKWQSLETFVTKETIPDLITINNANYSKIIDTPALQLYENDNSYKLIFIKPIKEMITANGFFDYKEKDMALLKDKYWMTVNVIEK
jgi:hypothetical protein